MIIAIKEKDKIVVGYTNLDTWALFDKKDCVDPENVAIKFAENGDLYAFSSMGIRADVFLYDDNFFNIEVSAKNVVKEIIPYLKNSLSKNDIPVEKGCWENALIICKDNRIYDINPYFKFKEIDDYICHGFQTGILKSVLDETKNLPSEERIIKAIKFCGEIRNENFFPIVITDTQSKLFKVVNGEDWYEYNNSI